MKKLKIFMLLHILVLPLFSQTTYLVGDNFLHPGVDFNFDNIQPAIDASADGDTIIVYPGRYWTIQVNFTGKNIYVTSRYQYTGDRNDIYNTIIDGNSYGSAVLFTNNETRDAVLNGFTIVNGIGEQTSQYDPQVRAGGGLYIFDASPSIINCIIKDNSATGSGGGIFVSATGSILVSPYLAGNIIKDNITSGQGGGVYISGANYSPLTYQPMVYFDSINKNSIFQNNAPVRPQYPYMYISSRDIFSNSRAYMSVALDTFTVAIDDPYYICMKGNYDFSCDNWVIEQIDHDLYVSVNGDDTNTGLHLLTPLKTISEAMLRIKSNPESRNTVHIAPGIYKVTEGQTFPIKIKSDVILQGAGPDVTIFDLGINIGGIRSLPHTSNFKISGIAFINCICGLAEVTSMAPIWLNGVDNSEISDCYFENNISGVHAHLDDELDSEMNPILFKRLSFNNNFNHIFDLSLMNATFEYIKILNNRWETFGLSDGPLNEGTPIKLWEYGNLRANYTFSNILIADTSDIGAFINPNHIYPPRFSATVMNVRSNIDVLINNATIVNNDLEQDKPANSDFYIITAGENSVVKIYNSILSNGEYGFYGGGTFEVDHSLVFGGPSKFIYCNLLWGWGNLNEDPVFDFGYPDFNVWPYQLSAASPCIDAGTTRIPYYTWLPFDLLGNDRRTGATIDMGAYEFNGSNNYFVDFEGSPRTGEIPLTVQFTDNSVGYVINSWQWDFNNDGIIDSTEQNPTYTYYTTGHKTVRIIINDGQASSVKPEYINPRPAYFASGTLQGIATSNGIPLHNVFISIEGTDLHSITNEWGLYTIAEIATGAYTLTASKTGYHSFTFENVIITINEVTIYNFTMSPVSESDIIITPLTTKLKGSYPNPFNPSTTIAFEMASEGQVVIDVYNIKGQRVKTLVNGVLGAGSHSVVWDGNDASGRAVSSGVYFYRMTSGGYVKTQKMLLIK